MAAGAARYQIADHSARLRAQGLQPVQIWVPDVRAPGFADEARRREGGRDERAQR
jgi:Protein  of unknown function (DUF3018)